MELEKRCEYLHKQLLAVESQKGKEAGASGLYVDSAATPLNLRTAAERVSASVQSFSRELLRCANKEWKRTLCTRLHDNHGITLSRLADLKFWVQADVARVAFSHLWNPGRHFLFSCLPGSVKIAEVQQHYFSSYQMLLADADKIPTQLTTLATGLPTSSTGGKICKKIKSCKGEHTCSCGVVSFEQFCHKNMQALEKADTHIWQLVPPGDVPRLREMFIAFLLEVWLIHLLALAFEQPACLFEVRYHFQASLAVQGVFFRRLLYIHSPSK